MLINQQYAYLHSWWLCRERNYSFLSKRLQFYSFFEGGLFYSDFVLFSKDNKHSQLDGAYEQ